MTPEDRSALMARIRSKDTKPELAVRKIVFYMGYRYRLHRRDLPGTPDLVFPGRKKVIFVHGCFWHSHSCGRGFKPKSNITFWEKKFEATRIRDQHSVQQLKEMGWHSLTIWECEITDLKFLASRIKEFLDSDYT